MSSPRNWLSYFLSNVYLRISLREIQSRRSQHLQARRHTSNGYQRGDSPLARERFLLTGFGSCVPPARSRRLSGLALFQEGLILRGSPEGLRARSPTSAARAGAPLGAHGADSADAPKPGPGVEGSPEELFKTGMARFDEGIRGGRPTFHTVATDFPASAFAENAEYLLHHLSLPRGQVAGGDRGLRGAHAAASCGPLGLGGLLPHRASRTRRWRPTTAAREPSRPCAGGSRARRPSAGTPRSSSPAGRPQAACSSVC